MLGCEKQSEGDCPLTNCVIRAWCLYLYWFLLIVFHSYSFMMISVVSFSLTCQKTFEKQNTYHFQFVIRMTVKEPTILGELYGLCSNRLNKNSEIVRTRLTHSTLYNFISLTRPSVSEYIRWTSQRNTCECLQSWISTR